jgi:hypothetical protein
MKTLIPFLMLFEASALCAQPDTLWTRYYPATGSHVRIEEILQTRDRMMTTLTYQTYPPVGVVTRMDLDGDTIWSARVNGARPYHGMFTELNDGSISFFAKGTYSLYHFSVAGEFLDSIWFDWDISAGDGSGGGCSGTWFATDFMRPAPNDHILQAGWYAIYCRTGSGAGRYVRVHDRVQYLTHVRMYPEVTKDVLALQDNSNIFFISMNDTNVVERYSSTDQLTWHTELNANDSLLNSQLVDVDTAVIVGANRYQNGQVSPFLALVSIAGHVIWQHSFEFEQNRFLTSLTTTLDGAIVGCGYARASSADSSRIFLFRINGNGELQWEHVYENPAPAEAYDLFATGLGEYIVVGTALRPGDPRASGFMMKTDHDPLFPLIGSMEVVLAGPPVWGYRMLIEYGSSQAWTIHNVCPGTTARLGGDARRTWEVQLADSSITFNTLVPAGVGVIDTFYLEHPTCAGPIQWQSNILEGVSSGPYSPPITAQLDNWSVDTTFGFVTVSFSVPTEPGIAFWDLLLQCENDDYFRIASVPSQGAEPGIHRYQLADSLGGAHNRYVIGHRDIYGWTTAHNETVFQANGPQLRVQSFDVSATREGNVVLLVTEGIPRLQRVEIWRSENEFPNQLYWRVDPDPSTRETTIRFVDTTIVKGSIYWYFPRYVECNGTLVSRSDLADSATAIVDYPGRPSLNYRLSAYPNPFNPTTTLEFAHSRRELVTVSVYDLLGRFVETVVSQAYDPGVAKVRFEAENLADGIYFAIAEFSSGQRQVTKLVLLK